MINNLAALKQMPAWVCWKKKTRDNGKISKLPVNPFTGADASTSDSATWGTYEEAVAGKAEYGYAVGTGFVFNNDGIVGIDIDGCLDVDGNLSDMAATIVEELDTYTEISPSGTGLHLLVKSPLELEHGRKDDKMGLEVYTSGRFFTITEDIWDDHEDINDVAAEDLWRVLTKFTTLPVKDKASAVSSIKKKPATKPVKALPDQKILEKMFSSKRGAIIEALYNGDISLHNNDHSAADMALCGHLAYWTDNNIEQMDRIFRSSCLMRDKWDEMHGSATYGEMTLTRAIAGRIEENDNNDESSHLCNRSSSSEEPSKKEAGQFQSSADFILSGEFQSSIDRFKSFAGRKTGFSNMDEKLSIYPGLYCIGAISSLGKTTFMTQLAEQMAASGIPVLFFSFEQTKFELVAKGLARHNARTLGTDKKTLAKAYSAIDLRTGKAQASPEVIKSYTANDRLFIIDCTFNKTVEEIIKDTEEFMKTHPEGAPVIIIDYLQKIAPTGNVAIREHLSNVVAKLKDMQKASNATVFVISSFNRASYMSEVSFESFKESGEIEYTCDAAWGMQLACIDEDPLFLKDNDTNAKKRKIAEEKATTPRRIELVELKTRFNGPGLKFFFDYYSNCDYFVPSASSRTVKRVV